MIKRLFHGFNHQDAYEWFERHGVKLMTQSDHCVFPEVQDSHAIINMFMHEIHRHNIKLEALLESENEFVQLQAIQKILTTSQHYFATEDILNRLDKLENI